MIQITCTTCKRVLSIDDAFAGGVCRCQHCGTIQTVPKKGAALKAASGAVKGESKTLFQNKARSAGVGSGSGLEDLADVVQSSGLSNADLRKSPRKPAPPPAKNMTPVLGLAAAVIVVLLIVVLVLVFRSSSTPAANSPPSAAPVAVNDSQSPPDSAPAATPSFCGIPIDHPVVVYVIDNGSSSADVFDELKSALFKSIESLGPDRRFRVVFWNPGSPAYPSDHATFAVKDNIDAARSKLQDVEAAGSTDPLASLKSAFADDPGQIFLVTAKAGDLDDSLPGKVMQLRGASPAKIDCIAINGNSGDKVLANIASQTGGVFLPLQEGQLKGFAFN